MFDSVCLCVFSHIVNFFYHFITSNRACFPSFSSNHIITRISYNIVCGCFFFIGGGVITLRHGPAHPSI